MSKQSNTVSLTIPAEWITGWESVETDTPGAVSAPRDRVEEQAKCLFATAWRNINSKNPTYKSEGWGYWFATVQMLQSLGFSDDEMRGLGR